MGTSYIEVCLGETNDLIYLVSDLVPEDSVSL